MMNFRFSAALLLLALPLALLNGCGGGGGGGGTVSPTATPTTAPTATVGARVLVVQLRDSTGKAVDGVVSLGSAPVAGLSILATVNGDATFNRNIAVGPIAVSAEVDGDVTSGNATVRATDTTVFYRLIITPRVTPAPTATVPPPPFPA